ncbi:MAG: type I methionyl aminopeptidase, partial [Candidatus Cloacimonetes bacterium]|nr:type I methionyl aminopeptidase [Candidatus Cloacimonadota bacterium]
MIYIKNESEINSIRESCKIVAAVLDGIGEIIR